MESNMENPTQQGASIQDRLESLLTQEETNETEDTAPIIEDAEEPVSEEEPEAEASDDLEDDVQEEAESLTADELAQYFGIQSDAIIQDEDGVLALRTKVDGKEGKAKLTDLLASYQIRGHLDNQNREVAEQKKALESKLVEVEQQTKTKLQQLEDVLTLNYNQLVSEFNAVDWQDLRFTDPAEYSAKQTDFANRQAQINQAYQNVVNQRTELEKTTLSKEAEKLSTLIPEWSDQTKASEERSKLTDYVSKHGINPELTKYADGVLLLRKAMAYDALQSAKPEVVKKIKAAPKLAKPGQPSNKQERDVADITKLKSAIKKSGGKTGIQEYLLRTGKV